MFKTFVMTAAIFLTSFSAYANECYSEKFTKEDVIKAIHVVIDQYEHLEFDEEKEIPCVFVGDGVDKNLYKETWGFVPEKVVNHYQWFENYILLMDVANFDSLVHEVTHYIQFNYMGVDLNNPGFDADYYENEAVRMQNMYR